MNMFVLFYVSIFFVSGYETLLYSVLSYEKEFVHQTILFSIFFNMLRLALSWQVLIKTTQNGD